MRAARLRRTPEAELREGLRRKVEHTDRAGLQPATLKALFEGYVADLEARGKGPDTVGRAAQTAKAFEAVLPALLPAAVGQFKERDVFAFREARTKVWNLRSTSPEVGGLEGALRQLVERLAPSMTARCSSGIVSVATTKSTDPASAITTSRRNRQQ